MSDTCDACGSVIHIGDWPYCNGVASKHVHVDKFFHDGFEPYIDHNVSTKPEGEWIGSRSERQRLMKENGLEYKKKTETPGRLFFDQGKR